MKNNKISNPKLTYFASYNFPSCSSVASWRQGLSSTSSADMAQHAEGLTDRLSCPKWMVVHDSLSILKHMSITIYPFNKYF